MNANSEFITVLQPVIDKAVADTARAFLNNSLQFHGDTGIMHYFYHRMMTHGQDVLFKQCASGVKALLLQSEQYTTQKYLYKGQNATGGRLDFAVIDPDAVPSDGYVPESLPAYIGFEVGRNKALDKMGNILADSDALNVKPGDAAKLIRELRFGKMKAGYLLEFYTDEQFCGDATHVFQQVVKACGDLGIAGMHIMSVVRGNVPNHGQVSVFPPGWNNSLQLSTSSLPTPQLPQPSSCQNPPLTTLDICRPLETLDNCKLAPQQELVVVVGAPGGKNSRYRKIPASGKVNPLSESYLAPNSRLVRQGSKYPGQVQPRAGDEYLYENKLVVVVRGGPEQSYVKWKDNIGQGFKVFNHMMQEIT